MLRGSCNLSYLGLFAINKRLSEYLVKAEKMGSGAGTLIRMKFKQEEAGHWESGRNPSAIYQY